MRLKQYSLRTERTYCDWIARFIRFHELRHPAKMAELEKGRSLFILCSPSLATQFSFCREPSRPRPRRRTLCHPQSEDGKCAPSDLGVHAPRVPFAALSEVLLKELSTKVTHEKFEVSGLGLHAQRLTRGQVRIDALPARRSWVCLPD